MINVIEAYESTVTVELADWIKMSVFSGLVFLSYFFYSNSQMDLFYYVGGATAYLLLVLMCCVINNVRNGENYIFPQINSNQFLKMFLAALVSIVPFIALLAWGCVKLLSLDYLTAYPEILPVCQWIVWILFAGVAFLSVMIFAKSGSPLAIFDFKTISNYSLEVLPNLLFVVIVMAIANALILGILGYVFALFLSLQHFAFIAICSFAVVINVVTLGNCLAQIEYEVVPREEKEHTI